MGQIYNSSGTADYSSGFSREYSISVLSKVFQEAIDVYTGTLGTAYGVLVTPTRHRKIMAIRMDTYCLRIRKTLIFASSLLSGDCKLPDDIQVIGKQALDNCSQIASLGIPSSVTTIEQEAFAKCRQSGYIVYER